MSIVAATTTWTLASVATIIREVQTWGVSCWGKRFNREIVSQNQGQTRSRSVNFVLIFVVEHVCRVSVHFFGDLGLVLPTAVQMLSSLQLSRMPSPPRAPSPQSWAPRPPPQSPSRGRPEINEIRFLIVILIYNNCIRLISSIMLPPINSTRSLSKLGAMLLKSVHSSKPLPAVTAQSRNPIQLTCQEYNCSKSNFNIK